MSLIIRLIALGVIGIVVLPRQLREARIKGELKLYRKGLFAWSLIYISTVIAQCIILFGIIVFRFPTYITTSLTVFASVGNLVSSVIMATFYLYLEKKKQGGEQKQ